MIFVKTETAFFTAGKPYCPAVPHEALRTGRTLPKPQMSWLSFEVLTRFLKSSFSLKSQFFFKKAGVF